MEKIEQCKRVYKLYGYEEGFYPIDFDEDLYEIGTFLEHKNFQTIENKSGVKELSLKNIKENAKEFYNKRLRLHEVPYCNRTIYDYLMRRGNIKTNIDAINTMNKIVKWIDPYKLPIKFNGDSEYFGSICNILTVPDDEYFINNAYPIILKVFLGKTLTNITTSSYIHELMHTQLDSQKKSILNYHNAEVLSIFIEDVYTYNIQDNLYNFRKSQLLRLRALLLNLVLLYEYIEDIDKFELSQDNSKYIQSTLIAKNLFFTYLSMCDKEKNELMRRIQKIIDGKESLEMLLNDLNITYENSKNILVLSRCLEI